jgi:hypothetical protein
MVHADADPAQVGTHVVDPRGHGLAALGGDDVVAAPRWRRPRGVPLPAGVLAVADQRLLLGLDGDDRLGALLEVQHPGGDGLDLRVAIRMLAACARLARPAQRRRRIPPWGGAPPARRLRPWPRRGPATGAPRRARHLPRASAATGLLPGPPE